MENTKSCVKYDILAGSAKEEALLIRMKIHKQFFAYFHSVCDKSKVN